MEDPDIKVIEKKMKEFTDDLDKFLDSYVTDDIDYGMLIQETMGFATFYAYLHHDEPDPIDFFVRKIKQLTLKEKEKMNKQLEEELS